MKTMSLLLIAVAVASTAFSQVKVPAEKPWTEDPELVEAAQFAHTFLDAVHSKNFSAAERMMNPDSPAWWKADNMPRQMVDYRIRYMKAGVKAHSKRGALIQRDLIAVNRKKISNRPDDELFFNTNFAFLYSSSKEPFIDGIVVMKKNGQLYIESFGTLR